MKSPERRLEVVLSQPVVEPLLGVIKDLADGLRGEPALPHAAPSAEAEFSELWAGELEEGRNHDVKALLDLFGEDFFAVGKIYLDSNNAESVARACSAIRLRLRERHLAAVTDEALEVGDLDAARLDEATRRAFLCYLFLATMQELIIQRIEDGTIG